MEAQSMQAPWRSYREMARGGLRDWTARVGPMPLLHSLAARQCRDTPMGSPVAYGPVLLSAPISLAHARVC